MFGSSSSKKTEKNSPVGSNVETLIGKTTLLSGTLNADGSVRIEGAFEGSVISKSDVYIGPGGKVKADITAKNVTISGSVTGNISVDEKLELLSGAMLNGDIKVKKLVIEEGAIFKGISETKNEMKTDLAKNPPAANVNTEAVKA